MIPYVTNHLWQSTWFAAAVALSVLAFRKNRAHVRFWLWFAASVKFLVPFALLMALGSRVDLAPNATRIAAPAVPFAMLEISEPFATNRSPVRPTQGHDWVPVAAACVWACGFAALALVRLRGWRRVRAAVKRSLPGAASNCPIDVRYSPGLLEPGVVGIFRPILLLPAGIEERLTSAQLTAVMAHELCHFRRGDNLYAAVHMVVEAVFWFHPLVWWIGAKLVEERERACDEEVLRQGSDPAAYAEGILNICKMYTESPLACVSANRRQSRGAKPIAEAESLRRRAASRRNARRSKRWSARRISNTRRASRWHSYRLTSRNRR